ncbi:GTP pyrophosphokinase [Rhizobium ruizarguesonis]|uniref:GTP pyrophosphokinase n=1 Tax=Rhizobium ruizarguesonis TaxID=2081791 RepID=UPI0010311339|nr:GTP pyrophosphokinase [Rhizobium ruizarguesonis]TAZ80020.1 GTP pyrophosphokinase [Rhizobium ruizarguesonis]
MADNKFSEWIVKHHPKYVSLTQSVELIMTQLLKDAEIPHLTVVGRTKSPEKCIEKVNRKGYRNPVEQLTDISGVRIVVYFDYDVQAVGELIEASFSVDYDNSSNRDDLLAVNEVGYRSVHYVCDLGVDRVKLQEHKALGGLKFEFQVRTVLQHAWAELAHDRNYKFSGKLPNRLERKLNLLAGLMETADAGFSDLSREIDNYVASVSESAAGGELEIEINALSVEGFVRQWAQAEGLTFQELESRDHIDYLLHELKQFDISTLNELKNIIPDDYAENIPDRRITVLGAVRDWMIISDPDKFMQQVSVNWGLEDEDFQLYVKYLTNEQIDDLMRYMGLTDVYVPDDDDQSL